MTTRLSALAYGMFLLFAVSGQAAAETYRIDVIIFLQGGSEGAIPNSALPPASRQRAIDPSDTGALKAAGIRVLPDGTGGLQSAWQHLANSHRYTMLQRISWIQTDPPETHGPALMLGSEGGAPSGLGGTIALLAGHYLHLDADIIYAHGDGVSHLSQTRRMRRDEVHYLDSPRIGVLAEVSKAE